MKPFFDLKKDLIFVLMLVFGAGIFLLLYSYYTSPISRGLYGDDASYFMMVGRQIVQGGIPYLDFFDQKGPLLFFIEALGMAIWDGRPGILFVQFIFLTSTLLLMYQIGKLFISRIKTVAVIILALFVFSVTMEGGNLTEEYSLPFVLLPLFLTCYSIKNKETHPPKFSFIYGICFACLIMIRITNSAIVCGIILFYFIYLILKKNYQELYKNALYFVLGTIVGLFPFICYFMYYDALGEMIRGNFILPFGYSQNGISTRSIEKWIEIIGFLSPAIFSLVIGFRYRKKLELGWLLLSCTFVTIVAFVQGVGYLHYYSMTIPVFFVALVLFVDSLQKPIFTSKLLISNILVLFSFTFILVTYVPLFIENTEYVYNAFRSKNRTDEYSNSIVEQASVIPEEERNSVWGYEVTSRWFVISEISPCFRYSNFQNTFAMVDSEIGNEITNMLDNNPPLWIILNDLEAPKNKDVMDAVNSQYEMVSKVNVNTLYKRK